MLLTLYGATNPTTQARVADAVRPWGATVDAVRIGAVGSVDVDLPYGCDAEREARIRQAGAEALAAASYAEQILARLTTLQAGMDTLLARTDPNTGLLRVRLA